MISTFNERNRHSILKKEFFNTSSRKLIFKTSLPNFEIIRVRAFDAVTFVAFEMHKLGLQAMMSKEFNYEEIYSLLDLDIGKRKLSPAKQKTIWILKKTLVLLQLLQT